MKIIPHSLPEHSPQARIIPPATPYLLNGEWQPRTGAALLIVRCPECGLEIRRPFLFWPIRNGRVVIV